MTEFSFGERNYWYIFQHGKYGLEKADKFEKGGYPTEEEAKQAIIKNGMYMEVFILKSTFLDVQ